MEDKNNDNEKQSNDNVSFYKSKKGVLIIVGSICIGMFIMGGLISLLSSPVDTAYETNSNDNTGYLTTNVLSAKSVQLNKDTFNNPVNHDSLFEVELTKHGFKQIEFLEIKKETYDNYLNGNNIEIVKKEQKTINNTAGYLLTINNEYTNTETFTFIFEKDGKYYEISSVDGELTWDSSVETDIGILLSAWLSKLPVSDTSSTTQTTEQTNKETNDGRPTESEYYEMASLKGDDDPMSYEEAMEHWTPGSIG